MDPAGSEPAMPARELPQTHATERAASLIASTPNAEGFTGEQPVVFMITDAQCSNGHIIASRRLGGKKTANYPVSVWIFKIVELQLI